MWYKNAIIYLLPDGWQLEAGFAEKLEQAECLMSWLICLAAG